MSVHAKLWAVAVGNGLEWFDFVIFGHFALMISTQFFPVHDPSAALLLSFATFGTGFLARPFGAILIGNYADRRGRKPALILTVALMGLGTALIAMAPPYSAIGLFAPTIILLGRLLQGFSAGGEIGSATTLLVELGSIQPGLAASWQFVGQALSAALAGIIAVTLSSLLDKDEMNSWGWRVPFVIGLLIVPLAFYLRSTLSESADYKRSSVRRRPALEFMHSHKANALIAMGLVVALTSSIYTLVFTPTFAIKYLSLSASDAFLAVIAAAVVQAFVVPFAGLLSDRYGPERLALLSTATMMLLVVPTMAFVVGYPSRNSVLLYQTLLGSISALYAGSLSPMIAGLFPPEVRATGISVSYTLAVVLFGGFAPFVIAAMLQFTNSLMMPAYYVEACCLFSLLAILGVSAGRAK